MYGMKVTTAGAAKIAAAALNGTEVVFSKIVWGDSSGTAYDPTGSETALVNQRHETDIQQVILVTGQPNVIRIDGLINNAPSAFTLLEIGIEDDEGDLVAIGRHPPQQIPSASDTWQANYEPSFFLSVSNSGVITVEITPENDFLTKEEADQYYDPIGSGVRQVLEGWAINVAGTLGYPIVEVDQGVLDARYWLRTETPPYPAHTHANATQSVAGFMSAPDKTKLDGINILGGTSIMTKVAEIVVTSSVAQVDLLSLPNVRSLVFVGREIELSPDIADPDVPSGNNTWAYAAMRIQVGAGASILSGASDYKNGGSDAAHFDYSVDTSGTGAVELGHSLVGKLRRNDNPSIIWRLGEGFDFRLEHLGNATRKTLYTRSSLSGIISNVVMNFATGDTNFRNAATAENRVRISFPGRNIVAGRFMAYALAA